MSKSIKDDTSREKLRHIIGACMCKDDDKSCWYTNNAQEVENDGTVQDNQVDAILNLIDQYTKTMCERARIDEWKLISESLHSAWLTASNFLSESRNRRLNELGKETDD